MQTRRLQMRLSSSEDGHRLSYMILLREKDIQIGQIEAVKYEDRWEIDCRMEAQHCQNGYAEDAAWRHDRLFPALQKKRQAGQWV